MSDTGFPLEPAPATPGMMPPAPMALGQILERVWQLTRAHWKPFAGIGLLPIGALLGFYAIFFALLFAAGVFRHAPAQPNPALLLSTVFPLSLLFIPIFLFIYGLYYSASSYAAMQADRGLAVSVREAFSIAWRHAARYAWLLVLKFVIIAGPMIACGLVVIVGAVLVGAVPKGNPTTAALFLLIPLAILLYGGAAVYAVVMGLRFSLAYPACVHERLTAYEAIRRSGVLTQGAKGRILVALLIIYAIGYAVLLLLYAVGMILAAIAAVSGAGHLQNLSPGAMVLMGLIVLCGLAVVLVWSVLLMAAYTAAFAVFYRDQCLRKDGTLPVARMEPA